MELVFYICVILVSVLSFFLKWTSANTFITLLLTVFGKLIPLFLIGISFVQLLALGGYLEKAIF